MTISSTYHVYIIIITSVIIYTNGLKDTIINITSEMVYRTATNHHHNKERPGRSLIHEDVKGELDNIHQGNNASKDEEKRKPALDSYSGEIGTIHLSVPQLNHAALDAYLNLKPPSESTSHQRVIFFDLDNTLYSKHLGIAEEMGQRIQLYFQNFLHLPEEESQNLGKKYYLDYGLAIKGLMHNFGHLINPDDYDTFVDGGLQLEDKLSPSNGINVILEQVQARKWIFTNAGLRHCQRVLRLLGIEGHFEGIIYCNYRELNFPAKPDRLAFLRAMQCVGLAGRPDLCWFVDDCKNNVRTAQELGWRAVHLEEQYEKGEATYLMRQSKQFEQESPRLGLVEKKSQKILEIKSLVELPHVFPELFVAEERNSSGDGNNSINNRSSDSSSNNSSGSISDNLISKETA